MLWEIAGPNGRIKTELKYRRTPETGPLRGDVEVEQREASSLQLWWAGARCEEGGFFALGVQFGVEEGELSGGEGLNIDSGRHR